VADDANAVIKITPLSDDESARAWENEAAIACAIGDAGAAPKIYRTFQCNKFGFIVMERLIDGRKLPNGTVIREYPCGNKNECDPVDHLERMPENIQAGFIRALETSIRAGYMHMDNHLENIGYLGPDHRPCLFDFGFTQKRTFLGRDFGFAMAFSLGQILEHAPVVDMSETLFFRDFLRVLGVDSMAAMKKQFPPSKNNKATLARFKTMAQDLSENKRNADVYVGTYCYAQVLSMPLDKRSATTYMDIIYTIRQGKAF
jgi:hypothetical protein